MLHLRYMFITSLCMLSPSLTYFNAAFPLQNFVVSACVKKDTDPVDAGHLELIQQLNDAATEGMSACWTTCLSSEDTKERR